MVKKRCKEKNCRKVGNFININNKVDIYCLNHKKENMINIYIKEITKCLNQECNKRPYFNNPESNKGIYCSEHKKENMIDVKNKKCIEENCIKTPAFNYNGNKPIYCSKHKKENMIDVVNTKCKEEYCNKRPNFNIENEKIGIYCSEHKKENMIDVKHKRCLHKNCYKQPNFNLQNISFGIYCSEHKKDGMIDIKHKRCLEKNCNIQPNFNLPQNLFGIYCSEHKKENMINVKSKKCLDKNCDIQPRFNLPNEKVGLYCSKHKKDNMINVVSKMCIECNDIKLNNKKYKGYCCRCFINKFSNEKISKNYKVKENHMTDFIKIEFKEQVMVFDKQTGGCSKRRPDCYIDKFTHIVIIECDENQHRDTSCENKRTMELFQDFGNRPIVFIRFNPDKYINKDGEKIPSSFKMHKTLDVPVIRNKKEWNNRLELLNKQINYWLHNLPNKELTYKYLFYDFNTIKLNN